MRFINSKRIYLFLLPLAAACCWYACSGDEKPQPKPPVAFDVFLKRFAPIPHPGKPYELGDSVNTMLKGMNDSLILPYLQPIRSRAFLQGADTLCEAPWLVRNPLPVQGSAVAYLQYTSGYGLGALLGKTDRYIAAEVFWGGSKRTYIVTYDKKGRFIDALLCRWDQLFNDDSSRYERTGTFYGMDRIEIRQEAETDVCGLHSFKALCHISPDGKFVLDSLRSPDIGKVVVLDSMAKPEIKLIDEYNTLALQVRLDKSWSIFPLDDDATLLQKASFDTMQLNGKGAPEVIVREERYTMHSYGPVMGGWVTYYDAWFVWDIDAKRQLFRAVDRFGRTDLNNQNELAEFCEYEIGITRAGIQIGEAKFKAHKPDHGPGLYVLRDGKYVLQK